MGIETDGPDGVVGDLPNNPGGGTGTYTVVSISGNPVYVSLTPDGNYDLAFYEYLTNFGGTPHVELDNIIIGISNDSNGATYYEVFNWGNNIADTNTTANTNTLPDQGPCASNVECDNRVIPLGSLYTDPATGITTGILIDVDTALSAAPGDVYYNYIVIISPNLGTGDVTQVDAIVVTEIPIPTPPPGPVADLPAQPTVNEVTVPDTNPTPSLEAIITELVTAIEDLVTSTEETVPTPSPEEINTDQVPTESISTDETIDATPVEETSVPQETATP
ncbi:MAG TPA: hypothetical protein PLR93_02330 [Anaerolineales bacterium]|nr:hypothetical protein [Anaerolineales bacterium]